LPDWPFSSWLASTILFGLLALFWPLLS